MTKSELAKAIFKAGATSTKQKAGEVLDAILKELADALVAGETITLPNFGTFKIIGRSARKGRNPQTGQEIGIPAGKAVKFTPAKAFREAVAKD